MTILNPFFGKYGGQYVPEVLLPALNQLEKTFVEARNDPEFKKGLSDLLNKYAGRPTPLTLCRNITKGTKTKICYEVTFVKYLFSDLDKTLLSV